MVLYQEHPPHPALAPYLACLWTCQVLPGASPVTHRVLPDNCMDILWQDVAALSRVSGMMSTVVHVPVHQPVRTVAARFKPGAAAYFFAMPLHELADQHPLLDELWGGATARQFTDALWSRTLSDVDAVGTVERLLLQRLRSAGTTMAPSLVDAAVGAIEQSGGTMRIETLATQLGVSRQHLSSQFRARVGLGAKQFARVCRFRQASERIRAAARDANQLDWACLALDLGYYDQPHLIHEFRQLAGSTPESFAAPPA
ncbi:AraC family transcriptional regulator [Massilia sp. DJPM01]|uniref:helix-turn-helix domain-containing protein n=1 Tax=Massilia sp. DJPM01 TaxID=3024404 RepID=UPI00259EBFCE|nr:AraC family transcriptional regulator [Massilia sp. DJPM01]MDM5180985.1 AraC family transcriptional regulator [Massilia sp. DJPM01]